jgi:hypothetical protein
MSSSASNGAESHTPAATTSSQPIGRCSLRAGGRSRALLWNAGGGGAWPEACRISAGSRPGIGVSKDVWFLSGPAIPVVGDLMRYTVSPVLGWLMMPKLLRKLFAPSPIPERFQREFPIFLTLRPVQLRAAAEETAFMIPWVMGMQARYTDRARPCDRQRVYDLMPSSSTAVPPRIAILSASLRPGV